MKAQDLQQAKETAIVGLGTTGLSVARFLQDKDVEFSVVDSRKTPPNADDLKRDYKDVPYHFGDFDTELLSTAKQLIVNPGIAVATPEIQQAELNGAAVLGDVELFAREIGQSKPIIAITGSNGKTTVTTLLDLMAKASDVNVATGGNIGTPALDLLTEVDAELFVLELSSYQLETTTSLQTLTAVVLNVSEDHLDRYDNDIEKYAQSKAGIYKQCKHIVCNRDDAYSMQFATEATGYESLTTFGLDQPKDNNYGVFIKKGVEWLVKGETPLMLASDIKMPGRHNLSNALAALALGEAAGLTLSAMINVLTEYAGMEHRTQWVRTLDGVNWYNDSKGTNVGATLAALSGLSGKTVLIAGGQGKGADFLPLQDVIQKKARAVILMGEDAQEIAQFVDDSIELIFVENMQEAVEKAQYLAQSDTHDNVLLSPACASFDMFSNYEKRGQVFMDAVNELQTQKGAKS